MGLSVFTAMAGAQQSDDAGNPNGDRETGLGDITVMSWFSPEPKGAFMWGAGRLSFGRPPRMKAWELTSFQWGRLLCLSIRSLESQVNLDVSKAFGVSVDEN